MAAYLNRLLRHNKVQLTLLVRAHEIRANLKLSPIIRFCGSVVLPFLPSSGQRSCKYTLLGHLCGFRQKVSFRYCLLIFLLTKLDRNYRDIYAENALNRNYQRLAPKNQVGQILHTTPYFTELKGNDQKMEIAGNISDINIDDQRLTFCAENVRHLVLSACYTRH